MGVGLYIYADCGHLGKSLQEIQKILNHPRKAIFDVLAFLDKVTPKKFCNEHKWIEWDNIGESKAVQFFDSDLWIEFQYDSCSINLEMNWFYFLDNRKTREAIRSLARELVWACGGSKAFYLPSTHWIVSDSVGNAFSDGVNFNEIEKILISTTLKMGNFFHQPVEPSSIESENFKPWTHEAFPFLVDVFLPIQ